MAGLLDSFKTVVTGTDGEVYGVPGHEFAMGGGIFYNRPIYEELGLSVPTTWEEFAANNEAIKAAGYVPVAQTYGDTWTSQLFVLADYFNVQAEARTSPSDYTANQAKYATTPAALRGFELLQEGFEAGWYNEDFGAANYEDGIRMVAEGEAAHYPMLTFAITAIEESYPESLENVGFFAQPGPRARPTASPSGCPAPSTSPATATTSRSPRTSRTSWLRRRAARSSSTRSAPPARSGGGLRAARRRAAGRGRHAPLLRGRGRHRPRARVPVPIKGPALEQITVEVGSGIRPAAEAAALYDQDVTSRPSSSASRAGEATRARLPPLAPVPPPRAAGARVGPAARPTPPGSSCPRRWSTACSSSCPPSPRSGSASPAGP